MSQKKVLVVGINPWVDNTGINTLINFFADWGSENLAHLYTRDGLPNTRICHTFFRISETSLIKSVLKRKTKTGETVQNTEKKQAPSSLYQKKRGAFWSFARELVWLLGRWKTPELDRFLDDFQPDILFFPVYAAVYMNRLQNYIARYTGKPVVLYSSDDNYSYRSVPKTPPDLFLRFWLRRQEKKLFDRAAKVLVISPEQKEEYDALFHTDCGILTKSIDTHGLVFKKQPPHDPIRMVYTGKLIIGRWQSLAAIAEALGKINESAEKIRLDIYTTDTPTEKQARLLNRNGCSMRGSLTLEEVGRVQKEADVLVFVESLERRYKYRARLSFSTKLTDYFKAGKCVFAIGDKGVAPIDYLIRNDAALTATRYDQIAGVLRRLADEPGLIQAYGQKAFDCGIKNHNAEKQKAVLCEAILGAEQ